MRTVRLGSSGLEISAAVLGMMSYGAPAPESNHFGWALGIDEARPIVRAAYEAGITAFDTSNNYSGGTSEQVTGELVKELGPREGVQIFTKLFAPTRPYRNGHGLSRAAILQEIDASLTRLGTDYVDLYQVHRFDPGVPVEETMEALHDVVKSGKARYIGASSMWAWQFAQMQHAAELHGWTRFVSMQDQYNLLQREEEREMIPFCQATGVGLIPWAPLASGYVTRPWGSTGSGRAETDRFGQVLNAASDRQIVDAVQSVAETRGVSMTQIALAWVASHSAVSAPIVGATKLKYLDDIVAGAELELTGEEIAQLEAPYTPRQPIGF